MPGPANAADTTIQLVGQMVGRVSDQIAALDRLNRAEFKNVNDRLEPLTGVPLQIQSHGDRLDALEEAAADRRIAWRDRIPSASMSFVATVTAVLAIVIK